MKLNLVTCLWGGLHLLSVQTWAYYNDPDHYHYSPYQVEQFQTKAQDRQLATLPTLAVFAALATLFATIISAFVSNIVNQNNGQLFPTPAPPTTAPTPPPPPPPITTRRPTTMNTPPTLAPSTGAPILPEPMNVRQNLNGCSVTEENLRALSEVKGDVCAEFCDLVPGVSHFRLKSVSLMDESTPNCACLSSCPTERLIQPRGFLSGTTKTIEAIDTSLIDMSCITPMEDMTCVEPPGNVAQLFLPTLSQLECVNFCQSAVPNYNGIPVIRKDMKSCVCMNTCTPIADEQEINTILVVSGSCRLAPRTLF